jgi:hypothetical protein
MRTKGTAVLSLLLVFFPLAVFAVDLNGQSRTYMQSRETSEDHSLLPLWEYLDFRFDEFATPGLSFNMGGWIRQDLTHEQSFDNRSFNGDLQYAYLGYNREEANAFFNFGRVLVYDGVASELVDGLSFRTDLKKGFGISAYGGSPVEVDYDDRDSDSIYGGRISHQLENWYRVGLSYLKQENDGRDYRSEAGVDLRLFPGKRVEVYGRSTYNGETSGWSEHSYYVTAKAMDKLRLNAEVVSTNYGDYFQAVDNYTTSVFNLQPGIIDRREKLLLIGGQAQYAVTESLHFTADYKNYDYSIADSADYYGGKVTYDQSDEWGAGFSLYRMDGDIDRLQYLETRLYGYKFFDKFDATVDLFNVNYDQDRNGESNAFSGSAALGYNFSDNARISADVEYGENPSFDYDFRAFVKFLYKFSVSPLIKPKPKKKAEAAPAAPAPVKAPPKETAQAKAEAAESAAPEVTAPPVQTAPAQPADPQSAQMAAWKRRIENTPTDKYTIQIEISKRRAAILGDLEKLLPKHDAMVLAYRVKGYDAYTLIEGIYNSRTEAAGAIGTLPGFFQNLGPLVKTMPTIQKGLIDEPSTGAAPVVAPAVTAPVKPVEKTVVPPVEKKVETAPPPKPPVEKKVAKAPESPAEILIDNIQKMIGPVPFPHAMHQEIVEQDCTVCHHMDEKGDPNPTACSECHGAMEGMPSFKDAMHKKCQGCHKEKNAEGMAAPVKCAGCHQKK